VGGGGGGSVNTPQAVCRARWHCLRGVSDEEAGSAGPVKWVGTGVGGTGSGQRGLEGRAEETESERELGRRLLGTAYSIR
jgi:hypothetical protein